MTEAAAPSTTVSSEAISAWLADRVAYYLECAPADLDRGAQLTELGLDSVYALNLCGDVEDHYGLVVEPTMAWDHPTVEAITAYLAAELAR
ncbi:acyl carrier protein [Streptomyces sp. NPDC007851]|uniref:acyl carrier protein n=1 Tax=Streptomyces sp. NPDC007851 TaxID=3155008 RepID=UPI00340E92F0